MKKSVSVFQVCCCVMIMTFGLFLSIGSGGGGGGGNDEGSLLRLNLIVPGLNLIDRGSLTITGKEKCRQKQDLQLAA